MSTPGRKARIVRRAGQLARPAWPWIYQGMLAAGAVTSCLTPASGIDAIRAMTVSAVVSAVVWYRLHRNCERRRHRAAVEFARRTRGRLETGRCPRGEITAPYWLN